MESVDSATKKTYEEWKKMDQDERMEKKEKFPQLYERWMNVEALRSYLELWFIAAIEEEFNCSGVCKPALFYWERNIYSGYPEETCAVHMIDYVR